MLKVIQLGRDPRHIIFSSQNTLQIKLEEGLSKQLLRLASWKKKSNHDKRGNGQGITGEIAAECGWPGEPKERRTRSQEG